MDACTIKFEHQLSLLLAESVATTEIISTINQTRKHKKLNLLKHNNTIDIAATIQAKQMADTGQFGHVLRGVKYPKLSDRMRASGYAYSSSGEVLYAGNGSDPEMVVSLWIGSKPHREAILHPDVEEIGVAVQPSNDGRVYICAVVCIPLEDSGTITGVGDEIVNTIKKHGKTAAKKMIIKIAQSDQMKEILKSPVIQKIIAALR
jgi:hypothetical protein